MTLNEGRRVRLAADTRLTDWVAMTEELSGSAGTVAGSLSLAAGTEGTVVRVVEHDRQTEESREYERLKSLLDAYGAGMPAESKKQLEEKVAGLEPAWDAYRAEPLRVTVRVRFDNGFILDDAREDVFVPA
ncbi:MULTISPECIES: hypothetical protein [unclassified Streptomyces]|uniref:hypothetical protein n=1 Tax=unclassified Streptomyces TaxID=2593676 RepID=UPI00202EA95D|nr:MULTISPECIES: hypothetical protein [unclassified Streptomyces]MCM1975521.1 hypothetical protein [Streptomyces sp. G1]MCX5128641.1 hypothetical protein [Streptomyces sp. NBC_00347]